MNRVIISGTGTAIPPHAITNAQLVDSYNRWAKTENLLRVKSGQPLIRTSDADFIVGASGIHTRRVLEPEGILDPYRMTPHFPKRSDDEISLQAEFALGAARMAMEAADCNAKDIDFVICAASHHQRPYPAIAIEVQNELGISGGALDFNLGCSSAVAATHMATGLVRAGLNKRVLIVTPEIITGMLNFRDRQTHFIFGDGAAAQVIEAHEGQKPGWEVINTKIWTEFSNNIRTNFGYLHRGASADPTIIDTEGLLIRQNGNKVFRDVSNAVTEFVGQMLTDNDTAAPSIRRFWLHQANLKMNSLILKMILDQPASSDIAPTVLQELGNTAAAGSIIAMDRHSDDLSRGDTGILCAFGAGYSIAGALIRKV